MPGSDRRFAAGVLFVLVLAAVVLVAGTRQSSDRIDDPDAEQARSIGAGVGWPTTIFYGADGKRRFVRQGGYVSQKALDEDIRTYAVG